MNAQSSIRKSAAGACVAALTLCLSSLGLAAEFSSTDFQQLTRNAQKAGEIERSGYEKLNLSAIGETVWVPVVRGAQGPLREGPVDSAVAAKLQAAERDLNMRLGPVGGRGTS
jgi:hypothetical protein